MPDNGFSTVGSKGEGDIQWTLWRVTRKMGFKYKVNDKRYILYMSNPV